MAYGSVSADTLVTSTSGGILGAGDASIMKNRLINSDMRIDQRNAGAAYTSANANTYTLDRWQSLETGGVNGKFTVQQNAGSVTPPVGFSNYLGITSQSAFSVTSGIIQTICQKIEGFNTSDLAWGTANAKTITISFWAYSSLTGTFGGVVNNGAFTYSYPFTYAISSANTWEYKTVTIAGPTAGTWVGGTNGIGLVLQFVIGTGSTYNGTAGSWSANGYYGVTGATNVTGTSGATLYITGVQLEVGSSATGFEYVNYQTSLANCQRYYQKIGGGAAYVAFATGAVQGGTIASLYIKFTTTMRSSPTIAYGGTIAYTYSTGTTVNLSAVGSQYSSADCALWQPTASSSVLTVGNATTLLAVNDTTAYVSLSAEL